METILMLMTFALMLNQEKKKGLKNSSLNRDSNPDLCVASAWALTVELSADLGACYYRYVCLL